MWPCISCISFTNRSGIYYMNLQLPAHVGHISVYLFIRGSNNFSLQLRNTTLKLSLPTLTHSMLAGVLMWGNIIIRILVMSYLTLSHKWMVNIVHYFTSTIVCLCRVMQRLQSSLLQTITNGTSTCMDILFQLQ